MLTKDVTTDVVLEDFLKEPKPSVKARVISHKKPMDLCSTCNYSKSCIHQKINGTLTVYCEEFDDYVPVKRRLIIQDESNTEPVLDSKEAEAKIYMGLCGNCDYRETCTHIKPESGIWHCEDYQ